MLGDHCLLLGCEQKKAVVLPLSLVQLETRSILSICSNDFMPCDLLPGPLQRGIGEKVETSPLCSEVEVLLGDHSLLLGLAQKAVELSGSLVQMVAACRTLGFCLFETAIHYGDFGNWNEFIFIMLWIGVAP